jgi:predicted MFS family arabinose efflux permease
MIQRTLSLYKNAYGGLSPSTWWLALVMLINRSGTMVVPFMTMYLTQSMGVSIGKAGLVMSLFGLGAIVGALLGGKITDRIGFYHVQLFTLTGGGIMFIVVGQMQSYLAICIATFFLSLINEAFRPANSVAIAHYSKQENITRSYSLVRLAINLGWAFGGALGGLIAGFNYEMLFWVDGITNISAAILLLFVLPYQKQARKPKEDAAVVITRSAYRDKHYMIFTLLIFLFAVAFFQIFTTIPVFYKEDLELSEFQIGIIMAVNGLIIAFFEMIIVFKLEGKRSYLTYIAAGTFLLALSYVVLTVPFVDGLIIGTLSMLIVSVGEIISMPFMNSWWLARAQLTNRGQYAALYTVAWASAQACGPFFGGQVAEVYGYNVLWYITTGICFLVALAFLWLQKKEVKIVGA